MIKVYQQLVDSNKGDCMRAVIASLLEKDLEDVPNFIEHGSLFMKIMREYLDSEGYKMKNTLFNQNYTRLCSPTNSCFKKEQWHFDSLLNESNIAKTEGISGYYWASVFSPKYFNLSDGFFNQHAVIVNKNLDIVHDPNPEYKNLLSYPLAELLKFGGILDVEIIEKK